MKTITNTLKSLGLTENEIKVYLALLQIRSAPSSVLAKQAGVPRSTAKYLCEELHKKDLIEVIQKGNTMIYTLESPERLFHIVEDKKEDLEYTEEQLYRIMGDMRNMMSPHAILPKIQFYEGEDAIGITYDKIGKELEANDEIVSFVKVFHDFKNHPLLIKAIDKFVTKRKKLNVTTRVLAADSKEARSLQKSDSKSLREMRIAPFPLLDFDAGEILIYKDTIWNLSISHKTFFCYTVTNSNFSKMYQSLFEIAWENAALKH